MFSSKEQLIKRTGKNSIDRYNFLKHLATEFKTTKSKEAKEQVLANLANFAYDPINYGYLRQLRIIDIFLHALSETNLNLVRFAIGGICNLCLDSINKAYIIRNQESQVEITSHQIIERISVLTDSSNNRIKNLATIFLSDYKKIKN
ncbi:hypothetical protein KM043_009827 [Ampulex compressa]|nr:hypothetical protein KM043_009827 [Ampulex compressa]